MPKSGIRSSYSKTKTSNKHRIYLHLYFEQGPAGTNATGGRPRVFHIGLWVHPKGSKSKGHCFDVQYLPSYSNRPDEAEGWNYSKSVTGSYLDDGRRSSGLIARIILGKLPDGIKAEQVHRICEGASLPDENENCWDWTGRVVSEINRQRYLNLGQDFTWATFKDRIYSQVCTWWVEVDKERVPETPHDWDIFGTDPTRNSQCTIL